MGDTEPLAAFPVRSQLGGGVEGGGLSAAGTGQPLAHFQNLCLGCSGAGVSGPVSTVRLLRTTPAQHAT